MNIVEVSEKNVKEAIELFKRSKSALYEAISAPMKEDSLIEEDLLGYETGAISYVLSDKGRAYVLFTIDKDNAELSNFCVDKKAVDAAAMERCLEFAAKQFSSLTFVFTWVDSLDVTLSDFLEAFGFEYTGEQNYLDKEKLVLRFRYVYRRKK